MERKGVVSFQGNGLTLTGSEVRVGQMAPDFTAAGGDLKLVRLSDFKGEIVIVSAVPSLDTPVCELQTVRFNQEVSKMNVRLLTISMDLPFAQARFCESHDIPNGQMLSDYKDRDFAEKYGLYMKELGLLARAVLVIDRDGLLAYIQIVPEMTKEPDYADVLGALRKLGA